jgi:SAM-dependent methyltransferase
VSEHHASNVWREFASWLVNEDLPPPSDVLDLGCDNGVLTCLYATLWPKAKIVGVERSAAGVAAARELAKRLGLRNVSFEQSDARRFLDANMGRFQIITATLVMHEFLAGTRGRKPFAWEGEYELIEDVTLSGERFPLTVARRARETDKKTTAAEIVSLASFKELSALNMKFQEDLADTFVRSVGPTEIMFNAVCEFLDGSGTRTLQLLRAPTTTSPITALGRLRLLR